MSATVSKIITYYFTLFYIKKINLLRVHPLLMFFWQVYKFFRSSHRRCFTEKNRNINRKVACPQLLKSILQHKCFPVNVAIFFKSTYFEENLLRPAFDLLKQLQKSDELPASVLTLLLSSANVLTGYE